MSFCNTIERITGTGKKKKLVDGYSFSIYNKAVTLPDEWDAANGQDNFFLRKKYLYTLEILHDNYISFRYVLVFKNDQPVFAAYFQINDFRADVFGELLQQQLQEIQSKRAKLFEHYLGHKKDSVVMRLVTGGNNFISGEHAFCYRHVSRKTAFGLLQEVSDLVGKSLKLRGRISATLIKDFYKKQLPQGEVMDEDFIPFAVEPNMGVHIPDGVSSIDEYIALFSKKYRNRAKAIFKCSEGVEKKALTLEEIKRHNATIYHLYEQVFERAKFKLVKLSYDYFTEMKRQFNDSFIMHGYFRDGQLVAFSSSYILEDRVEAHFIGFDYTHNKELECYQNLLYDFIEIAIEYKKPLLQLGRTASEIKSTVGAKADQLVCYIHPQNTVSKLILKPFISFLQPSEWTPRNPFKEE